MAWVNETESKGKSMELKHKLSNNCESLLQTETPKMTQYQAGALDFVEIENLRIGNTPCFF
ncbi:hypothetical protein AB6H17_02800 [Proteus vulgaris]|uniref:hypothetical protein n=1 Tax=Proteus vulgaris TaxID=585 RepID=UPI0034DDC69F